MRYSLKNKQTKNRNGWRFVDDHTGFIEWSDEAVCDYYGNMTLPKYADWQHPADKPIDAREDNSLPWSRPESTDVFLDAPSSDRTSDEY